MRQLSKITLKNTSVSAKRIAAYILTISQRSDG